MKSWLSLRRFNQGFWWLMFRGPLPTSLVYEIQIRAEARGKDGNTMVPPVTFAEILDLWDLYKTEDGLYCYFHDRAMMIREFKIWLDRHLKTLSLWYQSKRLGISFGDSAHFYCTNRIRYLDGLPEYTFEEYQVMITLED